MPYSSIIRKHCCCSEDCRLYPSIGFKGYNEAHAPEELRQEKISRLKERAKKRNANIKTGRALRVLAVTEPEVKAPKEYKSKSELMREADRLFSDYIKRRDTDKDGKVFCPCCNKYFGADDIQFGLPVINTMHFMDRDIYSLRYDEDAAHAGHAWCNKNQHYEPSGIEYQNFKKFLINKYGEKAVEEMEQQKRKVNKITEQQLKTVIEHYSTTT